MASPNLSRKDAQEALNALSKYGSQTKAAAALGIPRPTIQNRLDAAKRYNLVPGVEPRIWEEPDPTPVVQQTVNKIVVRVPAGSQPCTEVIRVLGIGDAHDDPRLPKDRFHWIGRYAAEHKIPYIRGIGDWATFDSLNSYDGNDTFAGRLKPVFQSDISSFRDSKQAFADGLAYGGPDYNPSKHECMGNHEDRMFSYENRHPETHGTFRAEYHFVQEEFGWTYSPYGAFHFVGGVGFTHAPLNKMGKAYGGKNAANSIANDALFDIVYGHDHKEQKKRVEKIGDNNYVVIGNLGCALPEGHIENYAKHTATGWSYGVVDMTIYGGHIKGWNFVPMPELEERYR